MTTIYDIHTYLIALLDPSSMSDAALNYIVPTSEHPLKQFLEVPLFHNPIIRDTMSFITSEVPA